MPSTEAARSNRIAFVLPNMHGGGAERVALSLIKHLIDLGHSVDLVLAKAEGELLPLVPSTVRVVDLQTARLRGTLKGLWRYFRREKPDAVQISMWPLTIIGILARRLARSKARLVVSDHANFTAQFAGRDRLLGLIGWSMRLLYPLADARICVSDEVGSDLAHISGLKQSCFRTVYNPIAPSAKKTSRAAADRVWTGDERRILAVGALKGQKNHALLLRAFAVVHCRKPANLLILGEGPLRAALEAQAIELGIEEFVAMPGFRLDPVPFYVSADLFVLSSDYEGFGNVLVEAMAVGLPVVSTDCPSGPREILEDGKYGRLTPVGNVEALAEAIEATFDNPPDPAGQKERARHFRPEVAGDKYRDALLGEGPA
jgi:glycosyltransferase involved in cell wall biosynthesis